LDRKNMAFKGVYPGGLNPFFSCRPAPLREALSDREPATNHAR